MTEADHTSTNRGVEDGFTLVELLVALALLGLMITLMLTAFHGGRQALHAVERKQTEPSIEAAQALLRELLSGARPPMVLPGSEAPPAFIGKRDEMIFTTLLEKRGQYGGLYRVRIAAVPRSDGRSGHVLIAEMSLHRLPMPGSAELERVPTRHHLLEGLDGLSFSYIGRQRDDEALRWGDVWTDMRDLPALVSLELRAGSPAVTVVVRLPLAPATRTSVDSGNSDRSPH